MPNKNESNINQKPNFLFLIWFNEKRLLVTINEVQNVVAKRKNKNKKALTSKEYIKGTMLTFKAKKNEDKSANLTANILTPLEMSS